VTIKKFNGICLVTADVTKLRHFYEEILQVEASGDDTFVAFPTVNAQLSIFSQQGMEHMATDSTQGAGNGGYTLEFEVEDVDTEHERLTDLKVPIVKPPTTQTWGRRSVWFRDPDGNIVNFYANVPRNDS
jgi:catechol 2,3-dioxygenase-like lactoylglutathione lyase family enzyme